MPITPEHAEALVTGATPIQIVILLFLGVIALGTIVWIVRWVVNLQVGTLPSDIREIKNSLNENKLRMAQMEAKLWTREDVVREVENAINEHAIKCPVRAQCLTTGQNNKKGY